jgi:hypothetical protein
MNISPRDALYDLRCVWQFPRTSELFKTYSRSTATAEINFRMDG